MRYSALPLFVSLCWLQPATACLEHESTSTGWVNQESPRSWEMLQTTHTVGHTQAIPVGLAITAITLVGTLSLMILRRRARSSRHRTAQSFPPVLAPFLNQLPTVQDASACSSDLAAVPEELEQEIVYIETEFNWSTTVEPVHETWMTCDGPNEHDAWADSQALTLV